VVLAMVVTFLATSVEIVTPSTRGPADRWFVHYGVSYVGGKHWQTPGYRFDTLEGCVQFVGQGPWAKAEHWDQSRF